MTFSTDLAIAAVSLFSARFSRGFSGFGAALVAMPILAIPYGPVGAVVIIALIEIPSTALLLPTVARQANWCAIMPARAGFACNDSGRRLDSHFRRYGILQKATGALVLLFAVLLATG